MKKRFLSLGLTALSILSILMLMLSPLQIRANVSATSPSPKTFAGYIPSAVTSGQARFIGQHPGTDQLALAIGLPLRNEHTLTQLLNEVSTPRNPHYRHYLTLTQENQAFNPTSQQEHQVIAWLQTNGLTVTHTYPNHLLVDTLGTFAQVERLLHITLNDYTLSLDGKTITFYAPASEPTVPGSVSSLVNSIVGLDNFPQVHTDNAAAQPLFTNGKAHGQPPFYPQDFANAYNVNPLWKLEDTGSNQHIGITHWGSPPSDTTLNAFAQKTGANVATQANGRLQVIQVPCSHGCSYNTSGGLEAGIDVESSSGMAPGATIDYYQVPTDKNGYPTAIGLENALNKAGSDGNDNQQISNSWYWECETQDAFTTSVESILLDNTTTGHDYFFGSGDNGSACVNPNAKCSSVQDPYPSYPASSAYVTSVGGTNLAIQNNSWQTEVAWDYSVSTCSLLSSRHPPIGSGGGYSNLFPEPTWQLGIPDPNNQRGYPDIAADADPYTGAYICYDGINGSTCTIVGKHLTYIGGTSLATPLWAGMIADVNQYVQSQNELPLGFINPLLYEIANGGLYPAFHDIPSGGTNGYYQTGPGWDAVTGLGSPNLYNFAQDAASQGVPAAGGLTGTAAVSATDAWAVGDARNGNGNFQTLIEHWNGTSWNVVSSPNGSVVSNVLNGVTVVSATDVWAVGFYADNGSFQTLIEHWNGTSWNVVSSPNGSVVSILDSVTVVSATDVWAVGTSSGSSLIEHWNGSIWNVVPGPSLGSQSYDINLVSVAAVSATNVWAVGYSQNSNVNGNYQPLIEHWNGTSWNVVSSPNPSSGNDTVLNSVTAVSASDVWAVGYSQNVSGNYQAQTLIEHWNGSIWNVIPSPNPGSGIINGLNSVSAVSSSDVWAVGDSNNSNSYQYTLIEHWNGTSWNVVPSPNPGSENTNTLNSVTTVSATDVWAVGESGSSGVYSQTLIEHWNGSSWNVVPSPNANALGER